MQGKVKTHLNMRRDVKGENTFVGDSPGGWLENKASLLKIYLRDK